MRYRKETILDGTESMERNVVVYEVRDRGVGVKDSFVSPCPKIKGNY